MNWNGISNGERLTLWKKLRDEIKDLQTEDQLTAVAKFCAGIPFGSRSIDYYSPKEWPSPWEILFHGTFCTSSISLLIFYTLFLLSIPNTLELYLVEDLTGVYLLPVIDNCFVLNYELGSINNYSEIQNDIKILQKYSTDQVKPIK